MPEQSTIPKVDSDLWRLFPYFAPLLVGTMASMAAGPNRLAQAGAGTAAGTLEHWLLNILQPSMKLDYGLDPYGMQEKLKTLVEKFKGTYHPDDGPVQVMR